MSLEAAFNQVLSLQSREVVYHDFDNDVKYDITLAPANYFRNLAGPEETVIEGREFVISKKILDSVNAPIPKRGFKIVDPDLGVNTITEVRDMIVLGKIFGFRVRTS